MKPGESIKHSLGSSLDGVGRSQADLKLVQHPCHHSWCGAHCSVVEWVDYLSCSQAAPWKVFIKGSPLCLSLVASSPVCMTFARQTHTSHGCVGQLRNLEFAKELRTGCTLPVAACWSITKGFTKVQCLCLSSYRIRVWHCWKYFNANECWNIFASTNFTNESQHILIFVGIYLWTLIC